MDSVVNMAMEQLMAGDNLSILSSKVGADEQSTKSALEMGLPLLLGAMSSKASSNDGANAILSGLADSAKGNSMQDMAKYFGSSSSSFGPGMLNSILGSSMIPIQQSIAKKTGLPQEVVGQLLTMALPLVLGYLTKGSSEKEMKPDDLSKLLDEQSKMALTSSPEAEAMMKDILSAQDSGSGFMGMIKKLFKSKPYLSRVGKAAPAAAAMQMSENSHKFLIGFQVLVVCTRLDSCRTVLSVRPNMFRGSLAPPHNADLETAPWLQKCPEFISMQKLICW